MHISKIQVKNYKCFLDSGEIEFKPGFNIIVGKNDSGKSALLEVIGPGLENKPHRSLNTVPSTEIVLIDNSEKDIIFDVSRKDIITIFSGLRKTFIIPLPNNNVLPLPLVDSLMFITLPSLSVSTFLFEFANA